MKGDNSGAHIGKTCTEQGIEKGHELLPSLWTSPFPQTSMCSPPQKLSKIHPCGLFMEASLCRHDWSHHGPTTKVILIKPTLVHNTLLTKAFQCLPSFPTKLRSLQGPPKPDVSGPSLLLTCILPLFPDFTASVTFLLILTHFKHSLISGGCTALPLHLENFTAQYPHTPSLSLKFLLSYHPIRVSSLTIPIKDSQFPSHSTSFLSHKTWLCSPSWYETLPSIARGHLLSGSLPPHIRAGILHIFLYLIRV